MPLPLFENAFMYGDDIQVKIGVCPPGPEYPSIPALYLVGITYTDAITQGGMDYGRSLFCLLSKAVLHESQLRNLEFKFWRL